MRIPLDKISSFSQPLFPFLLSSSSHLPDNIICLRLYHQVVMLGSLIISSTSEIYRRDDEVYFNKSKKKLPSQES